MKMEEVDKNEESTFYYFSFGSNMLKERISIHDPDVKVYKSAKLDVSLSRMNYECCVI